ncbi:tRNA-dihydrouridine synthase family protein [Candidatus Gracilibacteria bacterium]|nr:tRNA-dihydrouridine synthase family protein [Candidatus Gracilibacteria bacterium]
MHKDFWKEQASKGKLCFLAPMDGYGDSAYRQTMRKIAPHVFLVSEFYSSDGLIHSKFLADAVLPHQVIEDPLVIQIFGKAPEMFAKAAEIISKEKYNIAGIDVNMGCPAKKVVRSGHGSSLMINECTAFEIIKSLDESTHLPITVKTRLSFDGGQDLIKFGQGLQKAGARLLTIHGRTAKQAYTGVANHKPIYELQKHVDVPVVMNGDIMNFKMGMEKVKNLAGFMIGRGSFGNPWCFISDVHNPENITDPDEKKKYSHLDPNNFVDGLYYPTLKEMLDIMDFHAKALVDTKGEKKGSLEIRKHLVQYLKHFPGVKVYRKRLVTTESYENSKNIILEIRETFKDFLERRPGLGEITKEDLGIE